MQILGEFEDEPNNLRRVQLQCPVILDNQKKILCIVHTTHIYTIRKSIIASHCMVLDGVPYNLQCHGGP